MFAGLGLSLLLRLSVIYDCLWWLGLVVWFGYWLFPMLCLQVSVGFLGICDCVARWAILYAGSCREGGC